MTGIFRTICIFALALVLALPVARAQTDEPGEFESLSVGNQKIAEALFDAQQLDPDSETQAWSLDRIADTKQQGDGWGQIFKQMKSDGLLREKNLGRIVSRQMRNAHADRGSGEVVLTTASGRQFVVDRGRSSAKIGKAKGADRRNAGRRSGLRAKIKLTSAGGRRFGGLSGSRSGISSGGRHIGGSGVGHAAKSNRGGKHR